MANEVWPIQAQRRDEPQVMNDEILHPANMPGRSAFAAAGMERQIDAKPISQAARPLMPLDRCCSVEREDSRASSYRLYDGIHTIDFELYRFEFHIKLLLNRELLSGCR
jgi:hypothetical protein